MSNNDSDVSLALKVAIGAKIRTVEYALKL